MQKLTILAPVASSEPSTEQSRKSRQSLILRCQRIIFSAYRSDQYSDPEGYLTSLGAVLEQYSNEVVVYITDPRTGVQRHCKWPPTISEIVQACDDRVAELKRNERFANWGKNDAAQIEPPTTEKPTLEELRAKYGDNWGIDPTGGEGSRKTDAHRVPSWDEIVEFYSANPERTAHLRDGLVNLKALRN